MKTTSFLTSAAKAAFALAAVVMMSAVFTSCSKDSDDDDVKKFTNTVTLDGTEIKIKKAILNHIVKETYWLGLELEDGKEATDVLISLKPSKHNGKQINLTEQKTEDESDGWSVTVLKGSTWLCCGQETKSDIYKFSSGTMYLNVNPVTMEVEVQLTGGKIKTTAKYLGDGKEHTLAFSYKGTAVK